MVRVRGVAAGDAGTARLEAGVETGLEDTWQPPRANTKIKEKRQRQ
jgi:hypothetical protein